MVNLFCYLDSYVEWRPIRVSILFLTFYSATTPIECYSTFTMYEPNWSTLNGMIRLGISIMICVVSRSMNFIHFLIIVMFLVGIFFFYLSHLFFYNVFYLYILFFFFRIWSYVPRYWMLAKRNMYDGLWNMLLFTTRW